MADREALSGIDTAWLRMERPANRMVIVVVMAFAAALSLKRFRRTIATRFLRHRFRQRVVAQGDSAVWELDPDFDLDYHVRRTALPRPGGKRELQGLVGELIGAPFDPSRPLWQFHLIENYDGGSAVIGRLHHCYADGIALMQVLLSMTDESSAAAAHPVAAAAREPAGDTPPDWLAPITNVVHQTVRTGGALLGEVFDLLLHPTHVVDYAHQGVDLTAEVARLALMPTDSATRFKGKPTGIKCAAWSDRLPLHEFKAVAHATDCSVNDVLLSCAAGALRAYLVAAGEPVDGIEVRALVPVNLRPPSAAGELGNYFGLVAALLPVGVDHPLERLYRVRARMHELKNSRQALLTLGLLATLGVGPKLLQDEIVDLLASRATAVLTNVPGPEHTRFLAGAKLREIVCWVPQAADIGLGISMMSYDDGVQFGVVADRHLVRDPERIAAEFPRQFEQLVLLTLLGA
jgi:WS/DGAT/MGAT family acyltransferase